MSLNDNPPFGMRVPITGKSEKRVYGTDVQYGWTLSSGVQPPAVDNPPPNPKYPRQVFAAWEIVSHPYSALFQTKRDADLSFNFLTPTAGSVLLTGQAPSVSYTLVPTTGSISIVGAASSLLSGKVVTSGQVVVTGNAPSITVRAPDNPPFGLRVPVVGKQNARLFSLDAQYGWVYSNGSSPLTTNVLTPSSGQNIITGNPPSLSVLYGFIPYQQNTLALINAWYNVTYTVPRRTFVPFGLVSLTSTSGQITITGNAPSITEVLRSTSGQIVITGNAPTIKKTLVPSTGQVTVTGNAPTVTEQYKPTSGQLIVSGNAPTMTLAYYPARNSYQIDLVRRAWEPGPPQPQRKVPRVIGDQTIVPTSGQIVITGNNPTITEQYAPTSGQIIINGLIPTINGAATYAPTSGQLIITGNTPEVRFANYPARNNYQIDLIVRSWQPRDPDPQRKLPRVIGDVTITSASGQITITGNAPSITEILRPTSGQLIISGNTPIFNGQIIPTSGQLVITGNAPTITRALGSTPGQILVSGNVSTVVHALGVTSGQVVVTGNAPTLTVVQGFVATNKYQIDVIVRNWKFADPLPIRPQVRTAALTALAPTSGQIVITGNAPTLMDILRPLTGQVVISGNTPSLSNTNAYIPTSGQIVITGNAPTIRKTLVPSTGQVTITGNTPAFATTYRPTSGQVVITGGTPVVVVVRKPTSGSITISGNVPFVATGRVPTSGQIVITGNAPTIKKTIVGVQGQITISGNVPYVATGRVPTSGHITIIGSVPLVAIAKVPASGQIVITGNAPTIKKTIVGVTGQLRITGNLPPIGNVTVYTPTTGSITVSGNSAGLQRNYQPASGQLILQGRTPVFQYTYVFQPTTGELVLTGNLPTVTNIYHPQTGQVTFEGNVPALTFVFDPGAQGQVEITGKNPALTFIYAPTTGSIEIAGNPPTLKFIKLPSTGQIVISGNTTQVSQYITPVPPVHGTKGDKNVKPKVKPIYDYMVEGLGDRLFELAGVRPVSLNSTDDVQAIKKLREGRSVTYPFLVGRNTMISIAQNRGKPLTYLRRGGLVNITRDNKAADATLFAKLDYVFELTYVTNSYADAKKFAKRWVTAAVGGQLKFNIEYGLTIFEIGLTLDTVVEMPVREADPTTPGEYRVVVTATVRSYGNDTIWVEQQLAKTLEMDGFIESESTSTTEDPPNVNRRFFSFKKDWDS